MFGSLLAFSVAAGPAALHGEPGHVPGWGCAPTCAHGHLLASISPSQSKDQITQASPPGKPVMKILVFSRTAGFRHDSIETGVRALMKMGDEEKWAVDWTEDPTQFTDSSLAKYDVVVFLNTTGDILNPAQQTAFEKFVKAKKGFVGIHSAADTEYEWPFYGQLVGGYFKSHPHIQKALIDVVDRRHPSTAHLGATWVRTDEWYDYRALPAPTVGILLKLDTTSYTGHQMGPEHPIAWCHEDLGGRAWYTGGGHTKESYSEPEFLAHLKGGILWAARKK